MPTDHTEYCEAIARTATAMGAKFCMEKLNGQYHGYYNHNGQIKKAQPAGDFQTAVYRLCQLFLPLAEKHAGRQARTNAQAQEQARRFDQSQYRHDQRGSGHSGFTF